MRSLCFLLLFFAAVAKPAESVEEQARAIHRRVLPFDSHIDVPFDFDAAADGSSQFDLPKAGRGGLKGAALSVFAAQGPRTPEGYASASADAEKKYSLIRSIAEKNSAKAGLAYSPEDVRRLARDGKFAVVIGLLNTYSLGKDLDRLDDWYKRGARVVGFVHAGHNDWADSSRPSAKLGDAPEEHGGLSPLGKQAVARLNELGILIDVSQLSSKALRDVLRLTTAPVAATHSAVRALVDNTRSLTDDELVAIQRTGGVVQIVAFSNYLRPLPPGGKAPKATLAQYVDHIDYAVKKIGIDHVGIASDFNHGAGVTGFNDVSEAENVTAELLRRGYKEAEIAKLWSGNFLRVWEKAQAAKVASRRETAR